MKPLKILIVTGRFPPFEYRAISQVSFDQACILAQKGLDVTVLTKSNGPHSHVDTVNNINVHYVGRPNYNVSSWEYSPLIWNWVYTDYIHSRIIPGDFDLIHVHDIDFALPMHFLAKIMRIPLLSHFHVCFRKRAEIGEAHFNIELAHYYQYAMAKAATAVLTVSESERENIGNFLDCRCKIFVVPNGIKTEGYHVCPDKKSELRRKLGFQNSFLVLWGGRIGDWMKSPDIVGKAFSKVAASTKKARFIVSVVNNSPPENHDYFLSDLSSEARSQTQFFYPKNKDDLLDLFAIADLFVMPSRYEPFGLMALEAMACGVPIIISSVCEIAERLNPGEAGLMIDLGSPDESANSLSDGIIQLANDEKLRMTFSQNARLAANEFEMNKVADKLIEIYNLVLH